MLGFPQTTLYNKLIAKQKFYDNIKVNSALKKIFVEQIVDIRWKYKIASSTLNLAIGKSVTEIEVFHIRLKQDSLAVEALHAIDKVIPYHTLFVLESSGLYQLWIGYKEANAAQADKFNVTDYYHTDWQKAEDTAIEIIGLDMDAVYEGFVRQIADKRIAMKRTESLKESVERAKKRELLEKKATILETKVRNEKQFNIQIKLNDELKAFLADIEELR